MIMSLNPVLLKATTGVPHANDSNAVCPNTSIFDGTIVTSARAI